MAVRKSINQIRSTLQKKIDKAGEFWEEKQAGSLGNYSKVITVPGTNNMVYVRLSNGSVVEVFNDKAPAIYDWKVYVGRDKSQPSLLRVVEVRWVYNLSKTVAYVLFHHEQHQYPNPDTVWIQRDQFLPLLVLPNGGFHVRLYGDVVYSPSMSNPVRVANQADIDLSSHVVSAGARYTLMQVDATGTVSYIDGSIYSSIAVLRASAPFPVPTAGYFPICAIEFYEGQTQIRRDNSERNIIDLRMFTSDVTVGTAGQIHGATLKATPVDADEVGYLDSASSWALVKATWANIKAFLKTYFDTLYDAIGAAATVNTALTTHISDPTDAHEASAIGVTDVGGYFTSTDVEGALQELGAGGGGGGGGTILYDDLTAQIPAVSDHYNLAGTASGGIVLLFYNTTLQSASTFTMDVDNLGLTLSFSPVAGDKLIAVYGMSGIIQSVGSPAQKIFAYQNFR